MQDLLISRNYSSKKRGKKWTLDRYPGDNSLIKHVTKTLTLLALRADSLLRKNDLELSLCVAHAPTRPPFDALREYIRLHCATLPSSCKSKKKSSQETIRIPQRANENSILGQPNRLTQAPASH